MEPTADPVAAADVAMESLNADGTSGAPPPEAPASDQGDPSRADREAMDPSWAPAKQAEDKPADGPTPTESLTTPQTEDGKWFVNKYGGNPDEAAKGYKSAVAEMNRLKAENDALRQPPPPPQEQPKPEPSKVDPEKEFLDFVAAVPEVRHLDSKMVRLKGEYETVTRAADSVTAEVNELANQIGELQQTLYQTNDYEELSATRDKIKDLDRKRSAKEARLAAINGRIEGIRSEYENADVSIRIAVNGLRSQFDTRKAFEAHTRAQADAQQKVQNESVVSAIPLVAKNLGIPPEQMADFQKFLIRDGNAYLSMRDDDGVPYVVHDWVEFFTDRGQEWKGMVDRLHRTQSAEYAKRKQADATQVAPTGQAAAAPADKLPTTEREMDAWVKAQRL